MIDKYNSSTNINFTASSLYDSFYNFIKENYENLILDGIMLVEGGRAELIILEVFKLFWLKFRLIQLKH